MARTTPGVGRAVSVLTFLAAHSGEEFSLSELARRLELSKATCHAVLASLADAGFVLRHPGRSTYRLGPGLIALGRAAEESLGVVDVARDEMRALATRLNAACLATAVVGEEIVVVSTANAGAPLSVVVPVGQRLPLVPPFGTVFLAWAAPEAIDRWLRRLDSDASEEEVDRLRRAVADIRRRGYIAALQPASGDAAAVGPDALAGTLATEDDALVRLGGAAPFRISYVVAPVFGPDATVALALTLVGLPEQLPATELSTYARELTTAAARVTEAIHGRVPARTA
ncbi:DNA-binding transcriptional regulator, IclR family [Trujillonella endophytica]|uniref:DNA-binding transcriptional regulator, IclR family n=1 Tax=Trujillonella endophytica TaxID=673521 RepID=A0A1H8SXI4_9ACTN|nr:DNA-binding transcriptional regulator, IclR family [Trujillella endophytica]